MAEKKEAPTTAFILLKNGGFPVSNIAYWKQCEARDVFQRTPLLHIQFVGGGFIETDEVDATQFASLVFGIPF